MRLLGERLLAAGGKSLATKEALAGASAVGLYFSASWCPPCRGFTPQLADSYTKFLHPKGFRCVFISSDHDESAFSDYFGKMPWLSLPYEDRSRKEELSARFGVRSIPTLAVVDPIDGKTITTEAREMVPRDPEGKDYPWRPPLVRDLASGAVGRINEMPALICLCEAAGESTQKTAMTDLITLARDFVPKGAPEREFAYFIGTGGEICQRVRSLCGLPAAGEPVTVLLDVQDNGSFYLGSSGASSLDADAIRCFLQEFDAGSLQRKTLPPP